MIKKKVRALILFVLPIVLVGCRANTMSDLSLDMKHAPIAEKRPTERIYHDIVLHDDYLWLKDESYPVIDDEDILSYLKSENLWYEQQMKPRLDG